MELIAYLKAREPSSMPDHVKAAKSSGNLAKAARTELESKLGRSVISSAKASDYLQGKPTPKRLDREKEGKKG